MLSSQPRYSWIQSLVCVIRIQGQYILSKRQMGEQGNECAVHDCNWCGQLVWGLSSCLIRSRREWQVRRGSSQQGRLCHARCCGSAGEAFPGTHSSPLGHGSSLGRCFDKAPKWISNKVQPEKTASETLTPLKPMGFLPWSAVGQGFLPASPHSTLGCDVSRHRAMPALQDHSKAGCMLSVETRLNGKKCMQPFPKCSLLKPRWLQQHEL